MSLSQRINDTNAAPWVIEEIKRLEAKRDALAAHTAALRELCEYWILAGQPGPRPSKEAYDAWLALGFRSKAWTDTSACTPKLKAQWQAEALEWCAKGVAACKVGATPRGISIAIKMEAEELRRQAEEIVDD